MHRILIELDSDEITATQVHVAIVAILEMSKINYHSIDSMSIATMAKVVADFDIVGRWEDSPLVIPAIDDLDTVSA